MALTLIIRVERHYDAADICNQKSKLMRSPYMLKSVLISGRMESTALNDELRPRQLAQLQALYNAIPSPSRTAPSFGVALTEIIDRNRGNDISADILTNRLK
uniref:Uncharacterized protein n=1 Tax=Glossina pallidipes TaxID=7398 RepID=A0A1B0AHB1_GLOPL